MTLPPPPNIGNGLLPPPPSLGSLPTLPSTLPGLSGLPTLSMPVSTEKIK